MSDNIQQKAAYTDLQSSQVITVTFLASVLIHVVWWSPREALKKQFLFTCPVSTFSFLEFSVIPCVNIPPQTASALLFLHQ